MVNCDPCSRRLLIKLHSRELLKPLIKPRNMRNTRNPEEANRIGVWLWGHDRNLQTVDSAGVLHKKYLSNPYRVRSVDAAASFPLFASVRTPRPACRTPHRRKRRQQRMEPAAGPEEFYPTLRGFSRFPPPEQFPSIFLSLFVFLPVVWGSDEN